MNHAEITIRQSEQLATLQDRRVRRDLQTNLRLRRAHATPESRANGGLSRPALDLLPARRRADDDVVVSAGELLVAGNAGQAVVDALTTGFGQQVTRVTEHFDGPGPHPVCEGVTGIDTLEGKARVLGIQQVVLPRAIPLTDAVSYLESQGIAATVNHVAMMGGTAKGGATPKATTDTIAAQVAQSTKVTPPQEKRDGTLVVIIDTGIDAAVESRDDTWVTFVERASARDVDPLDVLDRLGAVHPDGKLDLAAGHGTFVAGIISQVAPNSQVVMLRAIATDGVCTEAELVRALCRAAVLFKERGATTGVVNLSLGLESLDDEEPPMLRAALELLPENVVVAAAAGNARTGVKLWPAASDRVCGVASLDHAGMPSAWSNCGDWVNFSARGDGVISSFVSGEETAHTGEPGSPFDRYPDTYSGPTPVAVWSGTSFAAPQVAGRLAKILEDHPGITRADAVKELQDPKTFLRHYGYRVSAL